MIEFDEYALKGVAKVVCKYNPSIYGDPDMVVSDMKSMAYSYFSDGKGTYAGTGGWFVVAHKYNETVHVTAMLAHYLFNKD